MVPAFGGEQQPLGRQVVHDGVVVLPMRRLVSSMPTISTPSKLS
jgi:hypothetical protein